MKHFITIIFVLSILSGFSQNVSSESAKKAACNFMQSLNVDGDKTYNNSNSNIDFVSYNGVSGFYAVNFTNGAFVLIANDYAAIPVLAYSTISSFDLENASPATSEWVNNYMLQIDLIKQDKAIASTDISKAWDCLIDGNYSKSKSKQIMPLMSTRWNQNFPYNSQCPEHVLGSGGHVYAGCVATAMSQIMKYYNFPETGRFSNTYYWGQEIEVDFSETTYQWDSMTNVINYLSRYSIATLMFHCGVAVNMNYDYDGSGSQIETAHTALKQYFKYRSGSHFEMSSNYDDADWKFMLREDLDKGHPILYRGTDNGGNGHAFVCDGYQDTAYFHFNWGWGGSNDGYFHVGEINPSISFYWNQAVIVNIAPYELEYCNSMLYEQPNWTITDGSGPNGYWNDSDCTWLIQPIDAVKISIDFTEMKTEEGADVLYVYDGSDDSAPLIGTYSGQTIPESIETSGGSAFLHFVSDNQNQDFGWTLNYSSTILSNELSFASQLNISPNPASDKIIISSPSTINKIICLDITGKTIQTYDVDNTSICIPIHNFNPGIYLVEIYLNQQKIVRRIIVE